MYGTARDVGPGAGPAGGSGDASGSAAGSSGYPPPSVSISLRHVTAVSGFDDDGEPTLTITDGESTVCMESGLYGVSAEVVAAARRLADSTAAFADTIAATMAARAAGRAPERANGTGRRPIPPA